MNTVTRAQLAETIYAQVGLMQPEATHLRRLEAQFVQVRFDVRGGHRHHFLEDRKSVV